MCSGRLVDVYETVEYIKHENSLNWYYSSSGPAADAAAFSLLRNKVMALSNAALFLEMRSKILRSAVLSSYWTNFESASTMAPGAPRTGLSTTVKNSRDVISAYCFVWRKDVASQSAVKECTAGSTWKT